MSKSKIIYLGLQKVTNFYKVCYFPTIFNGKGLPAGSGNVITGKAPILDKAHTAFRYLWQWNGEQTKIMSRVTDETGYTQPTLKQLIEARGSDMGGYHLNPITAWQIKKDGRVLFKPETWRKGR